MESQAKECPETPETGSGKEELIVPSGERAALRHLEL